MSSDPQGPSDDEIEAYLRGNDALSKAYRAAKREQPPREVDEAVLAFAQQTVRPRRSLRRRWQAPIALAAVLVLGLGLVLNLWREPEARVPAPAKPVAAPAPVAESAIVDEPVVADAAAAAAQEKLAQKQQRKQAQEQARQSAEQRASQEQMRRESERAESATARDRRQLQMERETTKRRTMQDAATAAAEAPPPPSPSAVAPAPPPPAFASSAPQSVQHSIESQAEAQPNVAEPAMTKRGQAEIWREPSFNGIDVAHGSRASVQAIYGAPLRQQPADSESATPFWNGYAFDVYEFNGSPTPNISEFYYDVNQKLVGIHRRWEPAREISDLIAHNRWHQSEATVQSTPPCGATPALPPSDGGELEYWVFPMHGAYIVVKDRAVGSEMFYIANCPG